MSPAATSSRGRRTSSIGSSSEKAWGFCLDKLQIGSGFADPATVAEECHVRLADRHIVLLTDFDGTLADLVPRPEQAGLSPAAREGLLALTRATAVTTGIVSGRRLADARARTLGLSTYVAGLHGLEIEGPGVEFRHATLEKVAPIIADLTRQAEAQLAWCSGLLLENKEYALTCHVRRVEPDDAHRAVQEFLAVAHDPIRAGILRILTGSHACELLPAVGWHKGSAAEWIRARVAATVGRPAAIVYLGDDRTDEDAFGALGGGDIGIGVGSRPLPHLIDRRLAGPDDVGRFLQHLAARPQYNH